MTVALTLSGVLLLIAWMWLCLAKREVSMPIWSTLELPELAEEESPLVSVIVSARNEAHNIGRCVQSLLRQDYPRFEIIAVDDHSSDGTWERLLEIKASEEGTLRVLRTASSSRGWLGRPAAFQQGTEAATGDWLLFTIADSYHTPNLLSRAMAYARVEGLGLLTLAPRQECRTFWEHVWQPIPLQYLELMMPTSRGGWASDAFLLISRDAYVKAGGHVGAAAEDHVGSVLMRRIKSLGYRVDFVKAMDLLQARAYRTFRELWDGWGAHLYSLLGAHPLWGATHAFALWAWTVLPFAALVPAFAFGFWGLDAVQGWWDVVLAVCAILAVVTMLEAESVLRRVHRQNHLYTATLPLGGLCLGAALMAALGRRAAREGGLVSGEYAPDAETLPSNERR
jgi:chlorobactene glucosyltransferase